VKIILWEVESGRKLQYIQLSSEKEGRYVFVTFSHDAKHLIYIHLNDIIIWSIEKEQAVITIPGHAKITSAALFLSDGEKIAVGHDDGIITIWNIENKQNDKTFSWRETPVNYLNVSHDGKRLLVAYKDGTILLWDISTGQILRIYSKFWIDFLGVSFEERDSYKNSWEKTMSLWRSVKGEIE
jgi:WD40 repeat protein